MKKYLISLSAGLALLPSLAFSQVEYATMVGFESKYVFRGTQLGDETLFGSVDITYGDFYAGVWAANPITDDVAWDNEIDFYAGYGFGISEKWALDVGVTHYYYPTTTDASTTEVFVGIAGDYAFSPAVYIYYDFDLEAWTYEGSFGYGWEIATDTTFDIGAGLGYIDPDGGDSAYYIMTTADINYSFNEYASGGIGVRWSDLEDADNHFYFGGSISVSF